jgi:hypothetical protein
MILDSPIEYQLAIAIAVILICLAFFMASANNDVMKCPITLDQQTCLKNGCKYQENCKYDLDINNLTPEGITLFVFSLIFICIAIWYSWHFMHNKKKNFMFFLYIIIQAALIIFFVISIINIILLHTHGKDDERLRSIQSIGVGTICIFIGVFSFYKLYRKSPLTQDEIDFLKACAPFLVVTGISSIIVSSKRLKILDSSKQL